MRKKMMNSILSIVLAAAMIFTSVPMDAKAAGNENLVRSATLSASSVEENAATLAASKAGDGDTSTQWSSDSLTSSEAGASQWLKATFNEVKQIKQIKVKFHVRNIDPSPANVSSFSIKYTDANGELKVAKENYAVPASGNGYATEVSIVLDETIMAKELQLCDFRVKIGSTQWNSVGIAEFEAYAESGAVSLDEVVSAVEGTADTTIEYRFALPEVPAGYEIEMNGADFEQIVSNNLKVNIPLVDKEVKISYKITETATGDSVITDDITYLVKGENEMEEGVNEKPVVIPEIQEWYSGSTEKVALDNITKVYYESASLKAIVDEFIADYEDVTGRTLEKTDKIAAGQFNFLRAEQSLGEEGYEMDINESGVVIYASSVTGSMYAAQTILQMASQNPEEMPIGMMRDYPRFEVRGLLLDIARKPIGMEMIRDIARTMRYYKMNDFQLHLSDNYIFLENYGKGANENEAFKAYEAFRLESDVTNANGESPTAKDYFIKKAELRDFIQDQRALGMNIVPEIDMPAHATSFTKIWPELMVQGAVSPLNSNRPLVDHFDVSKQAAIDKIKEIFDDYTTGENPTFDADTIVHVGADEFVYNYTAYRQFVNQIVPHVKQTNTVRMWGGFTWIKDNPETPIITEAIEGVEMNLWSKDWADGIDMYNMGYKLINTIDDYGYMVPNGSLGRSNAYGDLLNVSRIFNSFEPNKVRSRSGYVAIPSGDDQALGAVFAIWSDNIDKDSSGLTESDLYWRFFDALPFYAEKTWAATGQEKGSADALAALAQEIGDAPNTNPYYQADKIGSTYEKYDFENGLEDGSANNRDLTAGTATVADGALTLAGGNSYVTSPIKKLGNGNELNFDITLTEAAQPGNILFETTPEYGTHDIRIMEDGKLGFTRELHNYYFDYTLPVGETVHIRITAEQQDTSLYVNGELVGEAVGKFIHNGMEKKTGITHSTFAIPVERIGSATNAIKATIDNVVVKANTDIKPDNADYDYTGNIVYTTGSEQSQSGNEGPVSLAFDNNVNTFWHSEWNPTWSSSQLENYLWVEFELEEATVVDAIRYLPRPGGGNGDITGYRVEGTTDGTTWETLTTGTWTRSGQTWKLAEFEPTEVVGLRLVATSTFGDSGNNKFASAAELRVRTFVEAEPEPEPTPDPQPTPGPSVTDLFTDVKEGKWYVANVQYVYDNGLMSGNNGLFNPTGNVTRAQVVTTLYRLAGSPKVTDYSACDELSDVLPGKYYTDPVCWAYNTGVTTGNTTTMTFNVNTPVTRQQLASFFYRYAEHKGYDISESADISTMLNADKVSSYAITYVEWAVGAGIISGSETTDANGAVAYDLKPQATATRAQLAAILQRFCENNGI